MKRIPELDLAKSFIIIVSMIGIHTMFDLADLEPSLPASILNVLATAWTAPVFMFCMGFSLCLSHRQEPEDWLRRGIHLITIGMALNVLRYGPMAFTSYATGDPWLMKGLAQIFIVDILQFAGLAFMLLALCQKLKMGPWTILGLSLLMSAVGTLLIGFGTSSYVVDQVLGFFIHTHTCSYFPLLNWFIFVAAGNVMGRAYVGDLNIKHNFNFNRAYRYVIPVCGVVAIVHQYLSITGKCSIFSTLQNDWAYSSMPIQDALCIAFGVAPFEIGVFWLITRFIPEKWMNVLSYPSRHINQFYCVSWVWITWIAYFLYFIEPATTFAAFVPRWIGIVALTTGTVVVYNKWLKAWMEPCFSRHTKLWYAAVWIFVIVFGVWYFTHYQEPFIMPY